MSEPVEPLAQAEAKKNQAALRTRVVTALVGIPLVLLLTARGGLVFLALIVVLALISLRELERAARSGGTPLVAPVARAWVLLIVLGPWLATRGARAMQPPFLLVWLLMAALFIWAVQGYGTSARASLHSIALTLLATLYVGLWSFAPLLLQRNPALLWLVLAGVWAGDTAAYFAGRAFGRHKLTSLSPGKTLEGALGSLFASVVACAVVAGAARLGWVHGLGLGVVVGIAAPLGDLVESFWKRELGVKDLGNLLPGHGGVLDRCDSLLFSIFAVYVYAHICL